MLWFIKYNQACEKICDAIDEFAHWTTDHIPVIMVTIVGLGVVAVFVINYLRFS